MIAIDKSNPFFVLQLPVQADNQAIGGKGQELLIVAESSAQHQLTEWAIEQLITKPQTRLEYEIFEMPDTRYTDAEWKRFCHKHRKNSVDVAAMERDAPPPTEDAFSCAELMNLTIEGIVQTDGTDLKTLLAEMPFRPGCGLPPMEVRDVLFG